MLLKSSITKFSPNGTPEEVEAWHQARVSLFTSSEWHFIAGGVKAIDQTGRKYIWRKVGEELSGMPARDEVTTLATAHGHLYEPQALKKFAEKMGVDFLVTQKFIRPIGKRHGTTPDALWVVRETSDGLGYDVNTVEAKCPSSYDAYIELWNCTTPEEIKAKEKKYYWQVIHQMFVTGALKGYLVIYQPFFRSGGMRIIEFKASEVLHDLTFTAQRSKEAGIIYLEQRNKMIEAA